MTLEKFDSIYKYNQRNYLLQLFKQNENLKVLVMIDDKYLSASYYLLERGFTGFIIAINREEFVVKDETNRVSQFVGEAKDFPYEQISMEYAVWLDFSETLKNLSNRDAIKGAINSRFVRYLSVVSATHGCSIKTSKLTFCSLIRRYSLFDSSYEIINNGETYSRTGRGGNMLIQEVFY
jgi:hypothetical protein